MSFKTRRVVLVTGLLVLVLLIAMSAIERSTPATLFVNARLLTLEPDRKVADALLVVNGRIKALGHVESPIPLSLRQGASIVDAGGRVLMPGFVDAHSHLPAVDLARFGVDLTPPPDGDVHDMDSLIERLAEAPGEVWLLGLGYDESGLAEARHPTRIELDDAFGDRPIWLRHRSGHMGVGNSAALRSFGIGEDYMPPPGGFASRNADGHLDGLLQERAAPSLSRLLRKAPLATRLTSLAHARDRYLSAGVTTVQNGHASAALQSARRGGCAWRALLAAYRYTRDANATVRRR